MMLGSSLLRFLMMMGFDYEHRGRVGSLESVSLVSPSKSFQSVLTD